MSPSVAMSIQGSDTATYSQNTLTNHNINDAKSFATPSPFTPSLPLFSPTSLVSSQAATPSRLTSHPSQAANHVQAPAFSMNFNPADPIPLDLMDQTSVDVKTDPGLSAGARGGDLDCIFGSADEEFEMPDTDWTNALQADLVQNNNNNTQQPTTSLITNNHQINTSAPPSNAVAMDSLLLDNDKKPLDADWFNIHVNSDLTHSSIFSPSSADVHSTSDTGFNQDVNHWLDAMITPSSHAVTSSMSLVGSSSGSRDPVLATSTHQSAPESFDLLAMDDDISCPSPGNMFGTFEKAFEASLK